MPSPRGTETSSAVTTVRRAPYHGSFRISAFSLHTSVPEAPRAVLGRARADPRQGWRWPHPGISPGQRGRRPVRLVRPAPRPRPAHALEGHGRKVAHGPSFPDRRTAAAAGDRFSRPHGWLEGDSQGAQGRKGGEAEWCREEMTLSVSLLASLPAGSSQALPLGHADPPRDRPATGQSERTGAHLGAPVHDPRDRGQGRT